MKKKDRSSRRGNGVTIYFPPEMRLALDRERSRKAVPDTMSTYVVHALAEWLQSKEIIWRKTGDLKDAT